MLLAFDLITNLALAVLPHHFFELSVRNGDECIDALFGADSFASARLFLPDQPVTATGRRILHDPEATPFGRIGVPGKPVEVGEAELARFALLLSCNLILSPGQLRSFFSLRIRRADDDVLLPLTHPYFLLSWEGQGRFALRFAGDPVNAPDFARPAGLPGKRPLW